MAQPWLRLYTEILHDPKVQRLSDGQFRDWIGCLLAAKQTQGILPRAADLAWIFRTKPSRVERSLKFFTDIGLIDVLEDKRLKMHGWDSRQYESDTSAARMRRFRERHRDGYSDVTVTSRVTPPDTDTDTDTEKKAPSEPKKEAPRVAIKPTRDSATIIVDYQSRPKWSVLDVSGVWDDMQAWCNDHGQTPSEARLVTFLKTAIKRQQAGSLISTNGHGPPKDKWDLAKEKQDRVFMEIMKREGVIK